MGNNRFDEEIKASMQDLEVPYNADHWQDMEAALNDLEKPASAEVAFDAFISGKLGNLSANIQLPDWNRMEAALEHAGMPDQLFDKEVKSKVARIQPAYQPSHWELLAERLRREKAIKESLFKNKVAEVVIFALLLLNFYQYIPNYHAVESLPIITEPIKEKQKEINAIPTVETKTPTPEVITPIAQINKRKIPVKRRVNQSTPIANKSATNTSPAIDNRLFISSTLRPIAISGVSSQSSRQQVIFGIDGKTGLTITVPEMTRHLDYLGLSESVFVETIPSLEPASLATATVPLGCEKCKQSKIPARFRFGMVAHVGATNAVRSANQILNISGLAQKGNGYGSGFTLGFKYGNSEIETGLSYAAKSYAPNIDDAYQNGPVVNLKQFKRINLQALRIPVTARYNYAVFGKGKWHLYVQMGVAVNIILRAEYDIPDKPQASNKSFHDIAASSRLSRITYNKGILGGDSFKENKFFTFNLGPGAEYYLSPKWSFFLEPELNYYLSSDLIGPTQDRINSLSVSFGIKASFH